MEYTLSYTNWEYDCEPWNTLWGKDEAVVIDIPPDEVHRYDVNQWCKEARNNACKLIYKILSS